LLPALVLDWGKNYPAKEVAKMIIEQIDQDEIIIESKKS
jgi:hypothetical protein